MAFTVSNLRKTVDGETRVHEFLVTADGTSDEIVTGLDYIYSAFISPVSAPSAPYSLRPNVLTAATASNGTIAITGVASGAEYYVLVRGR